MKHDHIIKRPIKRIVVDIIDDFLFSIKVRSFKILCSLLISRFSILLELMFGKKLAMVLISFGNKLACNLKINLNDVIYILRDIDSARLIKGEQCIWEYLKSIPTGSIFLDVGAHIGKYTLPLAKIVGNSGLVIAVEPDPINYKFLKRGIEENTLKNVIALNIGAWNENGFRRFFITSLSGEGSLIRQKEHRFICGEIKVKVRKLDEVLEELNIKRMDYIKIDVEGAEYEVLEGLKKILLNCSPVVVVEVLSENYRKVLSYMKGLGYESTEIKMSVDMSYFIFSKKSCTYDGKF